MRNKIGDTGPSPLGIVYTSSLQPRKIYGHYVERGNARTESGFVSQLSKAARGRKRIRRNHNVQRIEFLAGEEIKKGRKSRRRVKNPRPGLRFMFSLVYCSAQRVR